MPKFLSAQYVACEPPQPPLMIRAVDEEGVAWWLTENCVQSDWLEFVATGGTVLALDAGITFEEETPP